MLDWHSCQICYPLEIKILLLDLYYYYYYKSADICRQTTVGFTYMYKLSIITAINKANYHCN